MNEGTAIEFAREKMKEMCVSNYILRFRHLRLDAHEKRVIRAENHVYILTDSFYDLTLKSKSGIYDLTDEGLNELQHIHRGVIELENQSDEQQDVKFIQVVPLNRINKTEEE